MSDKKSREGRRAHLPAVFLSATWLLLGTSSSSVPAIDAPGRTTSDDIAFAPRRDGNWEMYVMDATGGHQRRLTRRDAEDRFPLWSPDRRRIAFASLVGGTWELWVMDTPSTPTAGTRRG